MGTNDLLRAVNREVRRRPFRRLVNFVREAWPIVEGSTPYSHNWHIDLLCEHLEKISFGEIPNALFNVPPGAMKSIITSVMWPAWAWTINPEWRFLSASYHQDLATRDAVKSRTLIESPWYLDLWGDRVLLDRSQYQKMKYATLAGGWRMATSVGGRGTGEHPDFKIIDDPHNVKEAESDVERKAALEWFDLTLSSRGVSRDAKTVVIMQRLHEDDLAGHIMKKEEFKEEWEHVCLPMRYEPHRYTSTIGEDPRKEEGELLWPSLFDNKKVKRLETRLGEYGTAGQLQQRPSPVGGGILKIKHLQLWPASEALPAFEHIIQSYDTAFKPQKDNNDPDFSACSVYGLFTHPKDHRPALLILDYWQDRISYPELRRRAIRDWQARYGGDDKTRRQGRRPDTCIVEDKASGQSLIQDMNLANIPVFPYNPGRADKIQKAHIAAPVLELDRVFVMESTVRPGAFITWAQPLIDNLEGFPNVAHDDGTDTFTQAMIFVKDQRMLELDYVEPEEEEERDYTRPTGNPYAQ